LYDRLICQICTLSQCLVFVVNWRIPVRFLYQDLVAASKGVSRIFYWYLWACNHHPRKIERKQRERSKRHWLSRRTVHTFLNRKYGLLSPETKLQLFCLMQIIKSFCLDILQHSLSNDFSSLYAVFWTIRLKATCLSPIFSISSLPNLPNMNSLKFIGYPIEHIPYLIVRTKMGLLRISNDEVFFLNGYWIFNSISCLTLFNSLY